MLLEQELSLFSSQYIDIFFTTHNRQKLPD